MNNVHDLINPPGYLLSQNCYEDLQTVRDKLQLMGQLTGNASTPGDSKAVLLLPRVLLGEFFLDLSGQLSRVLDAVEYYAEHAGELSKH
ncbi:hypothetical protein DWU98_21305 [Dyella monticola]|uniref:XAC0095-like domain-containing protein n=1 Tax=Dyella monticola TaxID=1927958 RepID=A0A370WRL3_9GAMM|nr:hypothetical protein [Dyella monticola]RDS78752.1 hypothetical protein DWU98_21305 [Dyella monticola]